jgi:hypothetical protein
MVTEQLAPIGGSFYTLSIPLAIKVSFYLVKALLKPDFLAKFNSIAEASLTEESKPIFLPPNVHVQV